MHKNVSTNERLISGALGGLALMSFLTGSKSGRMFSPARLMLGAFGGGLLWRASSGHCPLYQRFNVNSHNVLEKIEAAADSVAAICVNKPIGDIRAFLLSESWSEFSFSPNGNADSLICKTQGRDWVLKLNDYGDGKRTLISMDVQPTQTKAGHFLGVVFASPIKGVATTVLRNVKALIETGEIATNVGQPHGERSAVGSQIEKSVEAVRPKIDNLAARGQNREIDSQKNSPNLRKVLQ